MERASWYNDPMNPRLVALFAFVIIAGLLASVYASPAGTIALVRSYSEAAAMHSVLVLVLAGIVYAFSFAFIIPVMTVLSVALGFLYGFVPAFLAVSLATLAGALAPFLYVRSVPGFSSAPIVGTQHASLVAFAREQPVSYLLATRFAPYVPFPLAHFIPAEARVKVRDYIWTTLIGALPASAAFVALGSSSRLLALGEPIRTLPIIAGLIGLSLLVFGVLFVKHKGTLLRTTKVQAES